MNENRPKGHCYISVKNVKHLKIQHLFDNPKKYSSYDQYPKNTDFPNLKPKKYSPDPCW